MDCFALARTDVPALIDHLGNYGEVIAPHRKGDVSFTFESVSYSSKVILDYNRTLLPLKKMFLPPREKLIEFSITESAFSPVEITTYPQVFFGVHSYDMQAILRLDHSMLSGKMESNYLKRRLASRFIGISFIPDDFHFSGSVGIPVDETEGFDLFLNRIDEDYQILVLTEEGAELLKGFDKMEAAEPETGPEVRFKKRLRYHYNRLPKVFDHVYGSELWKDIAKRCVGCGSCNLTCPTCYCFDVQDEVDIHAKGGSRERSWDSCMLTAFAEVAGGENFREKNSQRTRHRLYRKFKYITDQEGLPWCVGCGRCTAFCPAGISLPDIVNDLIREFEDEQYNRTGRAVG